MPTLTALASGHGFTSGDLDTSGYVMMVAAYQKVYFADGRTETDGGYNKLDLTNTRIVGTVTGTFTQGEVVTQSGGGTGIFDEGIGSGATEWSLIYRTNTTEFIAGTAIIGADSSATVTPAAAGNIVAPPHWTPWVLSTGDFPDGGSNIGCLFNGRIFMNDMYHPHHWYCTRAGDPLDLDTSQTDEQTAMSSQTAFAGKVGDIVTTFAPYKDMYLVIGTVSELWLLRGDPFSGDLFNITRGDGIFSPDSWVFDDAGNFYYVGLNGVYKLSADAFIKGGNPVNLIAQVAPKLMQDLALNRRTDRVTVSYNKTENELYVTAVLKDGTWSTSLCFDLSVDPPSLYPDSYATNAVPASLYFMDSFKQSERALLFGGQDGYIRKFDLTAKDDDNGDTDSAISSYVVIGPLELSQEVRGKGVIREIVIDLSEDTDGLTWSLYVEDSAEKVIDNIKDAATPFATGTYSSGGHQVSIRERINAAWFAIKLSNSADTESWSVEGIELDIETTGRIK